MTVEKVDAAEVVLDTVDVGGTKGAPVPLVEIDVNEVLSRLE